MSIVKDCSFNEEACTKEMGVDIDQALVAKVRGQSKSRRPKGIGKGNNRSQSRGRATCSNYGKSWHIKIAATHENMTKRQLESKEGL